MSNPGLRVEPGATWARLADPIRALLDPANSAHVQLDTSGSSGSPKQVRLSGAALRASGMATAQTLGGHGRWLLALPTHHVAGFQVLARSALAGTDPVALDPGAPFTPEAFSSAVAELSASTRRYASLVPTQLHRLLDAGSPSARAAASRLDAILLGGAAAEPELLAAAAAAGIRVVTTYGMSETAGGCVYDGRPLPGVRVRLEPPSSPEAGRIWLGGDVLADGYVGAPELTADRFHTIDAQRWFRTDDRGELTDDGLLRVLGRLDDVIVTGGAKVEPRDVETALRRLPAVADAVVLGLPGDAEWGEVVAAMIARPAGCATEKAGPDLQLDQLRDQLRDQLPAHALPRLVRWVDAIPHLASGKPDRQAIQAALEVAAPRSGG